MKGKGVMFKGRERKELEKEERRREEGEAAESLLEALSDGRLSCAQIRLS